MIKEIDDQELYRLLAEGTVDLVDVREESEFQEGDIPGAKNWPLSSFGLRQKEVSRDRPTLFFCRSGLRSMKAAEIAESWTSQNLFTLEGGVDRYQKLAHRGGDVKGVK
jgi:rhodanese-related sulfurtransferase